MSPQKSVQLTDRHLRYLSLTDTDFESLIKDYITSQLVTDATGLCINCAQPRFTNPSSGKHTSLRTQPVNNFCCTQCDSTPTNTQLTDAITNNTVHNRWNPETYHTPPNDPVRVYLTENHIANHTTLQHTFLNTTTPQPYQEYTRAWHILDYYIQTSTKPKNAAHGITPTEKTRFADVIEWLARLEQTIKPTLTSSNNVPDTYITGLTTSKDKILSSGKTLTPSCTTNSALALTGTALKQQLQSVITIPKIVNGDLTLTTPYTTPSETQTRVDVAIGAATLIHTLFDVENVYLSTRSEQNAYERSSDCTSTINNWYNHNHTTHTLASMFTSNHSLDFTPLHVTCIRKLYTKLTE